MPTRFGMVALTAEHLTTMMSWSPVALLAALTLFQVKHFACDFALQTPRQIQAKGNYGQLPGLEHAGLHALASIPAMLVLSHALIPIAIAVGGEFVIHYHVDWSKARLDRSRQFSATSTAYWVVFGFDQLIHQMTYLGLVVFLSPLR